MNHAKQMETLAPYQKGRASDASGLDLLGEDEGAALFDAVLYPNRSLPNAGFIAVMTVVIGANILFGTYFYAIGAWPVIGFCGLDVLAVWLAFKLSYRQGRLRERVRVTKDEMLVARVLPSGHETRWRLQPFWTRVSIDQPVRHESQVRVTSKGGVLILGSFLSPKERARFADALSGALGKARG
ncbi:DUF2244 domain-containing protein [Hyphococcus flavus]|uniref:DUF2244 domain-containing protein n=1 Tax=Hyphococcus flavus TaxID=1866326 RepID=A0AAE9ZDC2_9PROT|nr:DUF2244 domain-containing protein [Hyphococcus flavus]WDI32948.1 DUF2244 domain-containing protein [Hyphococcus flavus]